MSSKDNPQAYPRAAALYAAGDPGRYPWNEVVSFHLHHGTVIARPDCLLLVRPVISADPDTHEILTPLQSPQLADCWHVWLAVGNLAESLRMAALDPLPFVSWFRRGKLRIHPFSSLARHDQAENANARTRAATAGFLNGRGT